MESSISLRIPGSVATILLVVVVGAEGSGEKPAEPANYSFDVSEVHDTDRIEASFRDKKYTLRLANVVPFAKWPADLTAEQKKVRDEGLAYLVKTLKGKQVSVSTLERGQTVHGDIVLRIPEDFVFGAPSTIGWGIQHFNCRLIEKGYSIYQKDPPELFFPRGDVGTQKSNRETLYEKAEAYAVQRKAGVWQHEALVDRLRALSKPGAVKK